MSTPVKAEAKPRPKFLRQFELIERVRSYDPTADEALLNRAYVYAMKMHGSQLRASGDPYFAHPIEVAGILTDYRLDTAAIVTALLHDVIEDTSASRDDIAEMFGDEIAELVMGVTKLSRLEMQSEHTRQAENLRKFILAISKDVRVLLVKLADRLHNMRTLQHVSPAKRERISRETLDVYAPLARQIGCHRFATELEELSFEHLNPTARKAIARRLEVLKHEQGPAVAQVSEAIADRLEKAGISARVFGREKTPFSIWRKLQRKSLGFSQLSDIYAFRVIVENEEDCYRALGVIHRAWPSVPERFKDFISTPKRNNYRSLHTTVIGPRGMRIEMQIRTETMDRIAEEGVAAHWKYKNKSYGFDAEAAAEEGGRDPMQNLRGLVQVLEHGGGDVEDFVEHAKLEMFLDQVFVFTPKGRIISLPRGAMPLDFAYAVHTDVGDTAIGAKVNGELRPMRTQLTNGDVVDIIRGAKPDIPADWRSLTVTGRARSAIRRQIRQTEREEFLKLGRAAIEQAFARAGKNMADVSLRPAFERCMVEDEEELFEAAGRGRVEAMRVLEAVFPGLKDSERAAAAARTRIEDGKSGRLFVRGGGLTPGVSVHFAPCCSPVPGDRIVGIMEPDTGLTVHTIDCERLAEFEDREELWRDLQWTPEAERNAVAAARLRATIRNAPGVLGQACTIIGEAGANIINLKMAHRQSDFFDAEFDVEVVDAKHLTTIAAALRACPSVETVDRVRG
ncbi:bifunctional (p)ppGpp synthetase/guanosine-3',5'-bis(diphosphate) 3'-pyrophosphohydrolase [Caulobacter sp. 17J65-9]|uniref:RelA/SpoT family protein n=1 Tax=Caulobacter sp. 17J65-9 TaxID=2709382 RepID=UPI0013CC1415|nr:bifunctional (p)ppGpp synthetase/guanosine-3',5'-bis(diphosphate) 3'-pyrophosphohydrolase [Caulobacter sp. 17J65-9]